MQGADLGILLVDDDAGLRLALIDTLELAGLRADGAADAAAALRSFDPARHGMVVSDLRMPKMDGLELLAEFQRQDPDLPVVLMTGHGDIATAVSALHRGAFDFLAKPFANDHFVAVLRRALATRGLVLENRRLKALSEGIGEEPLLGQSPAMQRLRETLRQVAAVDVDVLIEGETGTGKELVARHLHQLSARRGRPFVALDCAALPEAGAEEILFGTRSHRGRISDAGQGTLFLDELDSLPLALQGRLAHLIETKALPGAGAGQIFDLRILAATKADLAQEVAAGRFRADLFYRLETIRLRVPPLRERQGDVDLLFSVFLDQAARELGRMRPQVSADIAARLAKDEWPGNLRELRNLAMQVVLGLAGTDPRRPQSLSAQIDDFEKAVLSKTLGQFGGDIEAVAKALALPRRSLYARLSRHGLQPAQFRTRADG